MNPTFGRSPRTQNPSNPKIMVSDFAPPPCTETSAGFETSVRPPERVPTVRASAFESHVSVSDASSGWSDTRNLPLDWPYNTQKIRLRRFSTSHIYYSRVKVKFQFIRVSMRISIYSRVKCGFQFIHVSNTDFNLFACQMRISIYSRVKCGFQFIVCQTQVSIYSRVVDFNLFACQMWISIYWRVKIKFQFIRVSNVDFNLLACQNKVSIYSRVNFGFQFYRVSK